MLKIKDNIDLKELEKFKKESLSWYILQLRDNTEESNGFGVSLFAEPRCIQFGYSSKGNGGISSFTHELDVIFDLIEAGLVEKVVE